MDIKILYTVVAIAEHGSFLAASRALGLSPAAVSLHVKIIEDELRVSLFDRSVRPPVLTEPGRRTLAQARRVIEAWELLGDARPGEVVGSLAIGAVPTSIATVLAPALARLGEKRPQLRVTLTTAPSDELEDRVARGNLDAALMMQPPSPPLDVRFEPVMIEPLHVIAAASVAGGDDATLLTSAPYLRFRRNSWIAHLIEVELNRRRLRLDVAMEIDTLTGLAALVAAGLGVSIVPAQQFAALRVANLRSLPFGVPVVRRALGLLRRSDHPKTPQLDELMAILRATVAMGTPAQRPSKTASRNEQEAH